MKFTYEEYIRLIDLLKDNNYSFCHYLNCDKYDRHVILRHDIDFCLNKALKIARIDYENNISSTFFVLLSTDFYNIFSKESCCLIKEIKNLGHQIGLHFDEKRYNISNIKELIHWVKWESEILSNLLDTIIKVVSMHRPSKWILENDIQFDGMVNTYSKNFFSDYKYLSDSRMHWKEDVFGVIASKRYKKLHILTHPFWYSNKCETINQKLLNYIQEAKLKCYYSLEENIRDLSEFINKGAVINENRTK